MGVGAIKVDFGEAAPTNGLYASGRTGFYEHNLYPLRYNKAVADITRQVTGENIIWARSAWAGSQRYPVHWGGDAENTDQGMAADVARRLVVRASADSRSGATTSADSCKNRPKTLPALAAVRHADLSHSLPRRAAQGAVGIRRGVHGRLPPRGRNEVPAHAVRLCAGEGLLRTRPAHAAGAVRRVSRRSGLVAGGGRIPVRLDILVAPLLEAKTTGRDVYLPPGQWIDYQTGKAYAGGWHNIEAGEIPVVMLVRDGAVIPHIKLAQSTMQMDWSNIELVVFAEKVEKAQGLVCLPADNVLKRVSLAQKDKMFKLESDLFAGKVNWKVRFIPNN